MSMCSRKRPMYQGKKHPGAWWQKRSTTSGPNSSQLHEQTLLRLSSMLGYLYHRVNHRITLDARICQTLTRERQRKPYNLQREWEHGMGASLKASYVLDHRASPKLASIVCSSPACQVRSRFIVYMLGGDHQPRNRVCHPLFPCDQRFIWYSGSLTRCTRRTHHDQLFTFEHL